MCTHRASLEMELTFSEEVQSPAALDNTHITGPSERTCTDTDTHPAQTGSNSFSFLVLLTGLLFAKPTRS